MSGNLTHRICPPRWETEIAAWDSDSASPPTDSVVLLDELGKPVGTAPRESVHDHRTPLHLAFSCYVFDGEGHLLVTRRALSKRTWPGVWTNSFCGHPRPGEDVEDAVRRHARGELDLEVTNIRPLLPDFRYRAVDASGVVEHEVCPVFTARTSRVPQPNPSEVMDLAWTTTQELQAAVTAAPWALSPWLVEQMGQLDSTALDRAARAH